MPGKTITLQYAGTCRECGTALHPGDRARYYGRGRTYGIGCHADTRPSRMVGANPRTGRVRRENCFPQEADSGYAFEYGQVSS